MLIESLIFLFLICYGVQLFYYVTYFKLLDNYSDSEDNINQPKISVLICAHNEEKNLKQNLSKILNQNYSDFEILVVDDRSTDRTADVVNALEDEKIKLIRIDNCEKGISPKKYALTKGFDIAKGDFILLTDADCFPKSKDWILRMSSQIKNETDIVLGFSPYEKRKELLNKLIQFDTFYTAFQYLSFALKGGATMGVGRNMLIRKQAFRNVNGYNDCMNVLAGDDDIIVQKIANKSNIEISLNPDSYMISLPKENWVGWINQKRRHMSVGSFYKSNSKFKVGVFQQSFVFLYIFALALSVINLKSFFIIVFLLILRVLIFYRKSSDKLGLGIPIYLLPFLEVLYFFNFVLIGISVLIYKKRKWN